MTAKPVVAATDGSAGSLRAIEWAVREAALHGAPLRITSAASLPKMVLLPLQPEYDAALGFVREHRDRALAAAAAQAAAMAPSLRVDTDPVQGQTARAVTASGSGALMLVVGFHGIGAFAATVLGSVARYAAGHAACPVVVVRDQTAAARRLVGVGVGDLDDCAATLAFAFEEAALRQASLIVIHAWHAPQAGTFWAGHEYPPPGLHIAAAAAARQLTLLMDTWRQKYPDIPVRHDVVHGHPGRALASLLARADLVVIGRHVEHSGPQCPGSVRHAVLNHAHGPVAIVPSS
jgi:nucleotide-binding universal stress UspA family protein